MAADGSGNGRPTSPSPWRWLPADLAGTAGLVVLTDLFVLLPGVSETPLRVLFGLPFLLFLPGYALVSALFPEAGPADGETGDADPTAAASGRIDGVERVALSFGLSIAIVPVVGLALHFTPWGIQVLPILVALSLVSLVLVVVAAYRRRRLPESERFVVPYRAWLAAARSDLLSPETRTDAALNVALLVSLVVAVAFTGYAVAIPKETEKFTEFYVLSENEAGELVTAGYPTAFEVGESKSVVLGVNNHEYREVRYSVLVRLQNVTFVGNDTVVERSAELNRWEVALEHDETWREAYAITPTFAGERLRVQFLLFRGDVPSEPSIDNAYDELHLWISVNESQSEV